MARKNTRRIRRKTKTKRQTKLFGGKKRIKAKTRRRKR
tara:strand:- start:368 stop:481 length:114 start_codon:yes stop_codon:yes gene_type:complete